MVLAETTELDGDVAPRRLVPPMISKAARHGSRLTIAWVLLVCSTVAFGEQEASRLRVGAWVTYWDQDRGLERLEAAPEAIRDIFFFAGALTEDGGLFLNGDTALLHNAVRMVRSGERRAWLTIVNDVHPTDGKRARLKDGAVVHRILSDEDRRRRHRNAIVELQNECENRRRRPSRGLAHTPGCRFHL